MWFRSLCIYACLHITLPVYADVSIAGSIEAQVQGRQVILPSLESRYDIQVSGDVVNVTLTQNFANPYSRALHARYLFPLNKQAAVHAMTLYVGDEVISAEISEIKAAKRKYQAAAKQGKTAALLQQHRPNMFTQKIANLVPNHPVKVVIEYSHVIPKVDGAFELVVPMVVGPRFQPAGAGVAPEQVASGDAPTASGLWELESLPDYPATAGVHLPKSVVAERVKMSLSLEAPLSLGEVYSDTHKLTVRHISSTQQEIEFAQGAVQDNKDFVLRYQFVDTSLNTGLLSHWENLEGGYFSLLIEPPKQITDDQAIPREMVFLLDCSGSMGGRPMEASKRFMREALKGLRSTDSFRIIRFSDAATEFSNQPLPATAYNIARGIKYTNQLYGSGGTMMESGIRQALGVPPVQGAIRNVVFLTDGYIGNEASILKLVHELKADARLFAFGVGSGVNRYLLNELGRVGRGFTRYYDPTRDEEGLEVQAKALAARLQSPALTAVSIDWGSLPVFDVIPAQLPDLYAGDTVRVSGRYREGAEGSIKISGYSSTQGATLEQAVTLPELADRPAIRRLWARNQIQDLMHSYVTPNSLREPGLTNSAIKSQVTQLGLAHALVTRWTAFVAVSRKVYNPNPDEAVDADVALPKVAGVAKSAYSPQAMTGYAAPEPGVWLMLLVVLFGLGFYVKYGRPVGRYR